ncbi:MAG TPA: EAL domain-containing protein [Devosia sp.]|nr:EAL domain-containing protein [Devosia sp.]
MNIKSKLAKGGAVVGAVAIFATAGMLFDNFVRTAATQMLQITIADISKGAEVAVWDATKTLDDVVANNAAICMPGFVESVRQTMQRSIYVRQIVVENDYGVRYCSGLEVDFDYRILSDELPIPGREETLAAIRPLDSDVSLLRITHKVDENRTISAFVYYAPILATGQLPGIAGWGDILRVEFTNGVSLLSMGDRRRFDFDQPDRSHIYASALAGDIPIRVMGSVPIEIVRAQYLNMYLGVLGIALLLCGGGLVAVWQRIERASAGITNLEHAIKKGEVVPYYQPVIDLSSGKIHGSAVMAKWEKPDGKILSGDIIVPYAQASNIMDMLLISLLKQTACDMAALTDSHPDILIGVGLGEIRFYDEAFVRKVGKVLSRCNIETNRLVFEVSAFPKLGKKSVGRKAIMRLAKAGFGIALVAATPRQIDLKYARALRAKVIWVQGEYAVGLDHLADSAGEMGIEICAHGVETRVQLNELRQTDVHIVSGDLIAPALKVNKFFEMLSLLNGAGARKNGDGKTQTSTSHGTQDKGGTRSAA